MIASLTSSSPPTVEGKINRSSRRNCSNTAATPALARSTVAARRQRRRASLAVQPLSTPEVCSASRRQSDWNASASFISASTSYSRGSSNGGIDARNSHRRRRRRRCQRPRPVAALAADNDNEAGSRGVAEAAAAAAEATAATPSSSSPNGFSSNNSSSNGSSSTECFGTGVEATCLVVEGDDDDDNNKERLASSSSSSSSSPSSSETTSSSLLDSTLSTLLLISPFFFWGSSMAAMKLLEPHTTPLFVAAVRLLPAGAALVAWAALKQKRPFPKGPEAWAAIAVFALVDGAMFQGFLAEGLRRTSAGLGSVIIDSQPLTVAALSAVFYGEELTLAGVLGLAVGVAGLCLLEVPPETIAGHFPALGPVLMLGSGGGGELGAAVAAAAPAAAPASAAAAAASSPIASSSSSVWDSGEFWMLLAAQSMAAGTLLVPWVSKRADPVMATGFHMILGGVPLLALALGAGGGDGIGTGIGGGGAGAAELASKLSGITPSDLALLAYISLLGSAASYGVFFYNASSGHNLARLSSLTFLTPGFAVATGYVFLGETLTPLQLVGAGVTLAAVALISTKGKSGGGGEKKEA